MTLSRVPRGFSCSKWFHSISRQTSVRRKKSPTRLDSRPIHRCQSCQTSRKEIFDIPGSDCVNSLLLQVPHDSSPSNWDPPTAEATKSASISNAPSSTRRVQPQRASAPSYWNHVTCLKDKGTSRSSRGRTFVAKLRYRSAVRLSGIIDGLKAVSLTTSAQNLTLKQTWQPSSRIA